MQPATSHIDRLHAQRTALRLLIIAAIGLWLFFLLFQAGMNAEFIYRISGGDTLFLLSEVVINLALIAGLHHVFLAKGNERLASLPLFIFSLWVFADRTAIAVLYWRAIP